MKKQNIIISVFILMILLFHLFLLSYSPLPWFDEVFFASITDSLVKNGNFYLTVSPLFESKEVLTYGPVYFLLTANSIKLFGWGIFQFRIINFLFSVATVIITSLILKRYIKDSLLILIFIAILLIDPMFTINSHSGRMDGVALFFIMSFIFFISKNNKQILDFILSGLFIVLAVLTTPRATIFLIIPAIIYLYPLISNLKKDKNFIKLVIVIIIPVILYLMWIFMKFHSIQNFIKFYTDADNENFGNKSLLETFIAFKPHIKKFEYPLIIFTSIFLGIFITKKNKIDKIIWVSILNIILFYLVLIDTGMYSIFIIPFLYLTLFISLCQLNIPQYVKSLIIIFIFIFNLSLFGIKNSVICADLRLRDYSYIDYIIKKEIPQDSKVIGNDIYFYSVIKNKCQFQTIERGSSIENRCDYHFNTFNFDYLVVSDTQNNIVETYLKKNKLELVCEIDDKIRKKSLTVSIANFFNIPTPLYSYEGYIYKRKDK